MRIVSCVVMSLLVFAVSNDYIETHKRQKRYLLFTPSSQWGVFVTVSIPLHPETYASVAWFFEASYYSVANASYFDPLLGDTIVDSRKTRSTPENVNNPLQSFTRAYLYTVIESMFERHGYPGKSCILRSICENAYISPLHAGVLGDILHLILTPSTSMSEDDIEDCYYEAEYRGLEEECETYYFDCPKSPLDIFSVFFENIT